MTARIVSTRVLRSSDPRIEAFYGPATRIRVNGSTWRYWTADPDRQTALRPDVRHDLRAWILFGKRPDDVCAECDFPRDYCECRFCARCQGRIEGDECSNGRCPSCHAAHCISCPECDDCSGECECGCEAESGNTIPRVSRSFSGWLYPDRDRRPGFARNPIARSIGVEIEIAACDDPGPIAAACGATHASVVDDGSLPSTGAEIVTTPAAGDRWVGMIEHLSEGLRAGGAEVTTECGLHVHVDARDLRSPEVGRLVRLYAAVERALFDALPRSRRDNGYCVPCGETYLEWISRGVDRPKKALAKEIYGSNGRPKRTKYHGAQGEPRGRYAALNLHSLWYRGTVEFRAGAGTVDHRKIIPWGILCATIVDRAARSTDAEIEALVRYPPRTLVRMIAPTDAVGAFVESRWQKFDRDLDPRED